MNKHSNACDPWLLLMSFAFLLHASGCAHFSQDRTRSEARDRALLRSIQVDISRLSEKMQGVEVNQEDLKKRFNLLLTQVTLDRQRFTRDISDLQNRTQAHRKTLSTLRKEIIDDLAVKIQQLSITKSRGSWGSQEGLEHTVGVGETLSEIAKAYGVTVGVIAEANDITNVHSIRVGTKLFIPVSPE